MGDQSNPRTLNKRKDFQEYLMEDGKLFYLTWFKYLKLSHEISKKNPQIKKNLQQSKEFYRPLGNYLKKDFNDIWKEKNHLFEKIGLEIDPETLPQDPYTLNISIPLQFKDKSFLEEIKGIIRDRKKGLDPKNYQKPHFFPYSDRNLNPQREYENYLLFEFIWKNYEPTNDQFHITKDILISFGKEMTGNKRRRITPYSFFDEYNQNEFNLDDGYVGSDFLKSKRRIYKRTWRLLENLTLGEFPNRKG